MRNIAMKVTIRISPTHVAVRACLGLSVLASLMTLGATRRPAISAAAPCGSCMVRSAQTIEDRIVKEAVRNNMNPLFPLRIAWRESRYQAQAVHKDSNGQHDWGVFQLSDHAVKVLHVSDPLDPQQNIRAAVGLLAHYLKVCGGSERAAAYAYARGRCPSKQPQKLVASARSPKPPENLNSFLSDPWYGTGSGYAQVGDGSFYIAGFSE